MARRVIHYNYSLFCTYVILGRDFIIKRDKRKVIKKEEEKDGRKRGKEKMVGGEEVWKR